MTAPTVARARAVITPEVVDDLVAALAGAGYTVIGPTLRDGAIVLDEVHGRADLPVGWGDVQEAGTYRVEHRGDGALFGYAVGPQSLRRFLFPPRRRLWSATRDGDLDVDEAPVTPPRYAFVGARPCELAALHVQDRVLREPPHPDPGYAAARDAAFVVAVNCARPAATCFCASTGTGPAVRTVDHDLALTEIVGDGPHRLVVDVESDAGAEIVAALPRRRATAADDAAVERVLARATETMTRRLDPEAARHVLADNPEHPRWDDVASRCLSCTNCTLVCPTCFCTAVDDVTPLDGARAERVQRWDSCFALDHSYLHGVGAVRADVRSRYRQWLTHKLSTWWDQFGVSGCVGCGRCITWCPAGIDLTTEVAAMSGEDDVT